MLPSSGPISLHDILLEQGSPADISIDFITLTEEWYAHTGKAKFQPVIDISITRWYGESWSTVPTAPRSLTAAYNDNNNSIDLLWGEPSSNGGSPITAYRVERRDYGAGGGWVVLGTSFATVHEDQGIVYGSTYEYRIYAINALGSSPASNVASAPYQNPLAPRNVALTIYKHGGPSCTLSWAPSPSTVTRYSMQRWMPSAGLWINITPSTTGTSYSTTLPGLPEGELVKFRVRAERGSLVSSWVESNPINDRSDQRVYGERTAFNEITVYWKQWSQFSSIAITLLTASGSYITTRSGLAPSSAQSAFDIESYTYGVRFRVQGSLPDGGAAADLGTTDIFYPFVQILP